MQADETTTLTLIAYCNLKHKMPVHQAGKLVREVLTEVEDPTAEELLTAVDQAVRDFSNGRR